MNDKNHKFLLDLLEAAKPLVSEEFLDMMLEYIRHANSQMEMDLIENAIKNIIIGAAEQTVLSIIKRLIQSIWR